MLKRKFTQAASLLIITLFSAIVVIKLYTFKTFVKNIDNQPIPNEWTPFITRGMIATEILCIVLLSLDQTRRYGFYAAATFFAIFDFYTVLILTNYFPYIPCSCGGLVDWAGWWGHLWIVSALLILSLVGARLEKTNRRAKKVY